MSEEKKSFNVKDRRMFTADGDVRQPEPDEARTPPAADSAPPAAADAIPGPPGDEASPASEDTQADTADDSAPVGPVDFPSFIVSLAAQGMQALVQQPPRLREARAMVSVLEMLKDKTEGRRTPEESDVIDTLLYQLRMGYLERQRAGGA